MIPQAGDFRVVMDHNTLPGHDEKQVHMLYSVSEPVALRMFRAVVKVERRKAPYRLHMLATLECVMPIAVGHGALAYEWRPVALWRPEPDENADGPSGPNYYLNLAETLRLGAPVYLPL